MRYNLWPRGTPAVLCSIFILEIKISSKTHMSKIYEYLGLQTVRFESPKLGVKMLAVSRCIFLQKRGQVERWQFADIKTRPKLFSQYPMLSY